MILRFSQFVDGKSRPCYVLASSIVSIVNPDRTTPKTDTVIQSMQTGQVDWAGAVIMYAIGSNLCWLVVEQTTEVAWQEWEKWERTVGALVRADEARSA